MAPGRSLACVLGEGDCRLSAAGRSAALSCVSSSAFSGEDSSEDEGDSDSLDGDSTFDEEASFVLRSISGLGLGNTIIESTSHAVRGVGSRFLSIQVWIFDCWFGCH